MDWTMVVVGWALGQLTVVLFVLGRHYFLQRRDDLDFREALDILQRAQNERIRLAVEPLPPAGGR